MFYEQLTVHVNVAGHCYPEWNDISFRPEINDLACFTHDILLFNVI